MQLYSTNNKNYIVDLKEATLKSLAPDKGLYMPTSIAKLEPSFFENIESLSFQEVAFEVSSALIGNYIPKDQLKSIISNAINFPAPVNMHNDHIGTLELFHGPSLAFKDFGARFMAEMMSYFIQGDEKEITILVATSGDTGGAVAAGFYDTPGINVVILYPKGKVSELQEKQLTTLGKNISAIEVNGTFDDCQTLVKQAFLDKDLEGKLNLSSANSINITRLIPQSFYYFDLYKQVKKYNKEIVVAVPSGNFGNLTAGLIAKAMGLPISHFIAATNINKVVPDYLATSIYSPRPAIATISNAMDVGNPSNFPRMMALYNNDLQTLLKDVSGFYLSDEQDKNVMKQIYSDHNYIADPHGAIGYAAIKAYQKNHPDTIGVYFETAHPSKFIDVVDPVLKISTPIPDRLQDLATKEKVATNLDNSFDAFKNYLLAKSF